MSRALVAFSDRGIERSAHVLPFRGQAEGPLTRYARSLSPGHYDVIWVLAEPSGEGPARAMCRELAGFCPRFEVRILEVGEVWDHRGVLESLTRVLAEVRAFHSSPHGQLDVLLPADPVSHAALALLIASGFLRARALQAVSGVQSDRVVREARLGELAWPEIEALKEEVAQLRAVERVERGLLMGQSDAVRVLRERLARLSRARFPVMLVGEPGSELEGAARQLHGLDARGAFVALSRAWTDAESLMVEILGPPSIGSPENLGSAPRSSDRGAYAAAHGGTLFIDHAEQLPLDFVHRLLRSTQPLDAGPNEVMPIRDVRWVLGWTKSGRAGTDADDALAKARARLGIALLEVPPLRTRKSDLETLIGYLLVEAMGPDRTLTVTREAMRALYAYDYPENASELRAEVHRWCAIADERVELLDLAPEIRVFEAERARSSPDDVDETLSAVVQRTEKEHIERALMRHGRNISAAARSLGIDRNTLKRKLKAFHSYRTPSAGKRRAAQ